MDIDNRKEYQFDYIVMEGTSYDIGKMQAEAIKDKEGTVSFFTQPCEFFGRLTNKDLDEIVRFNDTYCSGINEEIKGFADGLKVPAENILYYAASYPRGGNCGQFAVLPEITADGHTYVGRSYEWSFEEEMRLCNTRVKGKAAHLGFSIFMFGRFDGMNEHGLSVTMSMGVPGFPPKDKGVRFWVVLRTLLDQCKTVDEAEQIIMEIPISFYLNLIVADKRGEASLFEIACSKVSKKRIGANSQEKFICATNHYNIPEMIQYDANRMWQSLARYKAIENTLENKKPFIQKATAKEILSATIPHGLSCPYYEQGLGTLWSVLFDLTTVSAEICFGPPAHNMWHTFSLSDPVGLTTYNARFITEEMNDPDFWRKLPPGCQDLNG